MTSPYRDWPNLPTSPAEGDTLDPNTESPAELEAKVSMKDQALLHFIPLPLQDLDRAWAYGLLTEKESWKSHDFMNGES